MKKLRYKFLILMSILLFMNSPVQAFAGSWLEDEYNNYGNTASEKSKYEAEAKKIVSGINPNWPVEEKIFYIHDYIVTHTTYDSTLLSSTMLTQRRRAYDIIVNHKGMCQAYSMAFEDLCNRVGIKALRLDSNATNHSWNIVKVNGEWYYVDCTWDDPTGDSPLSSTGLCMHANLLKSEAGMRNTRHVGKDWDLLHDENGRGFMIIDGEPDDKTLDDLYDHNKYTLYDPAKVNINGKYNDTRYDNMNWHDSSSPFIYLNKGVIYYNDNDHGIYRYNCDGSKPKLLVNMQSVMDKYPGQSYDGYLTGNSETLVLHTRERDFQYTLNTGKVKIVKGSTQTNEDIRKAQEAEEKKAWERENYVFLKNGKAYYNSNNNSVYFQKDGNKAKKIVNLMAYTLKVPQNNRWGSSRTDCLSGNGYKLTIKTDVFDLEYNTKTGKLKQVRGHLKTASKFTLKDLTYKVTGSKQVSVTSIKGTKVTIPDTISHLGVKYKVTGIEKNAASGGKVKTLTIGKNVKSIGQKAFYQCPITKITVNSTGITSIGKNAFAIKGNKVTAKVPKKKLSKYKKLFMNAGFPKKGTVKY